MVTRYPARTHEGDLQNMTDQNAQPGPEGKLDAGGVSRRGLFRAAGNGQPNSNISNYTLFEIAYKAFTSVSDPHNKEEVAAAIHKVVIPGAVAGPMDFTSSKNPAPGVVITPPVGIQRQKGTTYPLEAKVVDNTLLPQAKITGDLLPTFK